MRQQYLSDFVLFLVFTSWFAWIAILILRAMYKRHSETTYKMLNDPHSDEKLVIEQEDFFT